LRNDGTLWLNLGDTYSQDTKWGGKSDHKNYTSVAGGYQTCRNLRTNSGLKPKDLVGIPWRVAFALQDDGWYLRSDIVWYKPNPMPESVTDRPTKAHEYLFLLAKSQRYYYDHDAVKEPAIAQNHHDLTGPGYHAPGQNPQKTSVQYGQWPRNLFLTHTSLYSRRH
ncbi:MAG: site-specific DNA-methyltransferase, partial [Firmicutes bacterium]|nr:site-specific DNA-methyltransferase [Bacillota bacterium]